MEKVYGVWAVRSASSIFGADQAWCKDNGRPLEFETLLDAKNYAEKLNRIFATMNTHYYAKEKEPEPNAVRIASKQPDMDALAHADHPPRNDAAEKQNEITGRQIASEPDPLVEIRSAVHSNYAGMIAMLGADNRIYLGKEENYYEQSNQIGYYDNRDGSLSFITDRTDMYYFLYGEGWAHSQEDMLSRGLTMDQYQEFARLKDGVLKQFDKSREILFAGKPFQNPENYLRNAELDLEGEKGNYNMIDGIVNNAPPARADLTDGQTYEEIKELALEILSNQKPSIMEKLKEAKTEKRSSLFQPDPPERGF